MITRCTLDTLPIRGSLDRGGDEPADQGERRSDGSADRRISVLLNYFTQMK
jgi:hypothetical protein